MFDVIVGTKLDLEMLKTAFANALKVGPVAEVDPAKGYRLDLGTASGGGRHLSPWYPHPESGGATRTWMPLSKGQIVGVMNPAGDPRKGVLFRAGFSGQAPPPSQDLGENVFTLGAVRVSITGDTITATIGDTIITIAADRIVMDAGRIDIG